VLRLPSHSSGTKFKHQTAQRKKLFACSLDAFTVLHGRIFFCVCSVIRLPDNPVSRNTEFLTTAHNTISLFVDVLACKGMAGESRTRRKSNITPRGALAFTDIGCSTLSLPLSGKGGERKKEQKKMLKATFDVLEMRDAFLLLLLRVVFFFLFIVCGNPTHISNKSANIS
jgi:hypothetical protein